MLGLRKGNIEMRKRITRETGLRRLLYLARLLEKLPRRRFYFGTWVGGKWKGSPDLSCGTAACAFGWATTVKQWRKEGLRLGRDGPYIYGARTQEATVVHAARAIFAITEPEMTYLFVPDWSWSYLSADASNLEAAAHIRKFVAGHRRGKSTT